MTVKLEIDCQYFTSPWDFPLKSDFNAREIELVFCQQNKARENENWAVDIVEKKQGDLTKSFEK